MYSEKIKIIFLNYYINQYLNWDGKGQFYEHRDRIATINNLKVVIYSNDYHPAHFHVVSNDKKIDAKFKIENGEYISEKITSGDIKKIAIYYDNDIL